MSKILDLSLFGKYFMSYIWYNLTMSFTEKQLALEKELQTISDLLQESPDIDNPHHLREQMATLVSYFGRCHEMYRIAQQEGYQNAKKLASDYLTVIPQWLSTAQSLLKSLESERRVSGI